MFGPDLDGVRGPELQCLLEPELVGVDSDHPRRPPEAGGEDGGEADGSGADHRDGVARAHAAGQDADLVAGGQRVGQEDRLLVRDVLGQVVQRGVRVGHAHGLGLGAVDQVPEDPADAADRLAVGGHVALAVLAASALGDGRHQDPVADLERADGVADLGDRADRLVAQDAASVTAGTSPARMCRSVPQMVVVSTRTTTSVGSWIAASGTSSQDFLPGPW